MRGSPRLALATATALLMLSGCGHGVAETSTHPADAPPRWVGASEQDGTVLSLYEGWNSVGVHEVHADRGWKSRYVKLDEPADALASLDGSSWAVAHGQSGRVVVMHEGETPVVLAELDPAPLRLATGDLDRDGTVDVVVASDGPRPLLHLIHGKGDGFAPPRIVPLDPKGRQTPTVTLVDLDGEGSLDVVAALSTGDKDTPIPDHIRVFRNTAHGYLADEWRAKVPSPERVRAGDFDEDGLPDVLVTGSEGAWLHRSAGYGWLDTPEKISGGAITDGQLVDVDGDGHLDIVLLDADRPAVEIRPGVGAGRTAVTKRHEVGEGPVSLAVATRGDETLLVTANASDKSFTTVRVARSGSRRSGT